MGQLPQLGRPFLTMPRSHLITDRSACGGGNVACEPQQGLLETSLQKSGRLSHDFLSYEDFLSVPEMELSWDAGTC